MLGKIIGIIGALGIIGSTLVEWATSIKIKFGEVMPENIGGIELIQGQIAAGAAVLALVLLFFKPKLALVPALIALGMAVWFFIEINGTEIEPQIGLWLAIGGSVLVALGGMMTAGKKR